MMLKRLAMAVALDAPVTIARRFAADATVVVRDGPTLIYEGPAEGLLSQADAPRLLEPVEVVGPVTVTIRKPPDLPVPRGFSVVLFYVSGNVEQVSDYEIEPWSVW